MKHMKLRYYCSTDNNISCQCYTVIQVPVPFYTVQALGRIMFN
jgi:hypothetical protein